MIAKEAKRISEDVSSIENDVQYKNILQLILIAARKGEFSVSHYNDISRKIEEKLRADGYTLVKSSYRGEVMYTISWNEAN